MSEDDEDKDKEEKQTFIGAIAEGAANTAVEVALESAGEMVKSVGQVLRGAGDKAVDTVGAAGEAIGEAATVAAEAGGEVVKGAAEIAGDVISNIDI